MIRLLLPVAAAFSQATIFFGSRVPVIPSTLKPKVSPVTRTVLPSQKFYMGSMEQEPELQKKGKDGLRLGQFFKRPEGGYRKAVR